MSDRNVLKLNHLNNTQRVNKNIMANDYKATQLSIYAPNKDSKFHKVYGLDVRATVEFTEAFLTKDANGKGWVLSGFLESCDNIKKGKGFEGNTEKIYAQMQIEKEGDKATPANTFLCEHIEATIGLGKENPFTLIASLNGVDKTGIEKIKETTNEEVKQARIEAVIPVLGKIEPDKLDKCKDLEPATYYAAKGGGGNGYGGGSVKALSPAEKFESIKPLLGVEGATLKEVANNVEGLNVKVKETFLSLLTAICQ